MKARKTLQDYIEGRNNNFNLLRMIGALTIMFAHAMFITIGDDITFETYPVKYTLGITTLNLFFVLSGMLVTASWFKHEDVLIYVLSRVMRIVPGLMVVAFVVPFLIGPFVTSYSISDYFSSPSLWLYWPFTVLLNPDMTLPGVFEGLPNDGVVNAPLWTLRYEAFLYALVVIAGVIGIFKNASLLKMALMSCFAVYVFVSFLTPLREIAAIDHLMHFGYAFMVGVCFHVYQRYVRLSLFAGLVGLGIALLVVWQFGIVVGELLLIPSAALIGCWIAYVPGGFVRGYNLLGDYSYGLYIWHYPIEQVVRLKLGDMPAYELFLISLPVVLAVSIVSWHFIERPALKSISAFYDLLSSKFKGLSFERASK